MNYVTGLIDVAHMDRIDFDAAVKGGVLAATLKVCNGVDAPDPKFLERIVQAAHACLLVSGYAFGTDEHPGADQWADFRVRWDAGCASVHLDPTSLPVWLDYERTAGHIMAPDKARDWLAAGRRDGYRVGLYGGLSNLTKTFTSATDAVGDYDLWLACYGNRPAHLPAPWAAKGWRLWQYTDGAYGPSDQNAFPRQVRGVGGVDRSAFEGDVGALVDWWRGPR